jgi:predicted  nucleic acid-binding Zn-ribbon protein
MRDRSRALERERKSLARWADKARLLDIKKKLRDAKRRRPERIREIRRLCREAQRGTCRATEAAARAALEHEVGSAHGELEQQRAYMKQTYGRKGGRSRTTARERREESDDDVRRNLPHELVPVFNRVRNIIQAGPRMSRTEAFLEWVTDNEDEVHGILYDAVESDVAKLVREQQEVEGRLRGSYDEDASHRALTSGAPF